MRYRVQARIGWGGLGAKDVGEAARVAYDYLKQTLATSPGFSRGHEIEVVVTKVEEE